MLSLAITEKLKSNLFSSNHFPTQGSVVIIQTTFCKIWFQKGADRIESNLLLYNL